MMMMMMNPYKIPINPKKSWEFLKSPYTSLTIIGILRGSAAPHSWVESASAPLWPRSRAADGWGTGNWGNGWNIVVWHGLTLKTWQWTHQQKWWNHRKVWWKSPQNRKHVGLVLQTCGLDLASPPTIGVQPPAKGTWVKLYFQILHVCKKTSVNVYGIYRSMKGVLRVRKKITDFASQTPASSRRQTPFRAVCWGVEDVASRTWSLPSEEIKRFGEGKALGDPRTDMDIQQFRVHETSQSDSSVCRWWFKIKP